MVRIKHRYLLVNILYPQSGQAAQLRVAASDIPDVVRFHQPTPSSFKPAMLFRLIQDSVTELFGDYGNGMITGSLKVTYLSTATSTAIIRVSRESYRLVWAGLSFAKNLPSPLNTPCVIQVVRVSGTIRKCEEAAIQYATEVMRKASRDARAGAKSTVGGGKQAAGGEIHGAAAQAVQAPVLETPLDVMDVDDETNDGLLHESDSSDN